MKHAKDIRCGDLNVGDKFLCSNLHTDVVAEVKSIRKTKTGRINFEIILPSGITGWSNGAMSPNTLMQK